MTDPPRLRLATEADAEAISALMRSSILALFPDFYDERQTTSAAVHVAHLDPALIHDRTYFVHEVDGPGGGIVACGGWSRRGRLFAGSGAKEDDDRLLDPATEAAHVRAMFVHPDWTRRGLGRAILEASRDAARAEGFTGLDLMATLPGVPLYRAFGFREVQRTSFTTPGGVTLEAVSMERRVDP
jgi:GNAT superfamily N-acetyltransferase